MFCNYFANGYLIVQCISWQGLNVGPFGAKLTILQYYGLHIAEFLHAF